MNWGGGTAPCPWAAPQCCEPCDSIKKPRTFPLEEQSTTENWPQLMMSRGRRAPRVKYCHIPPATVTGRPRPTWPQHSMPTSKSFQSQAAARLPERSPGSVSHGNPVGHRPAPQNYPQQRASLSREGPARRLLRGWGSEDPAPAFPRGVDQLSAVRPGNPLAKPAQRGASQQKPAPLPNLRFDV